MKKILLTLLVFISVGFLAENLYSYPSKRTNGAVYRSSTTKTNDSTAEIEFNGNTSQYLHTIVVSSASTGGFCIIYDSQGSATNEIATIDLGTLNTYIYDVKLSSGLSYTTTGNSNGVVITGSDE